MPNGEEHRPAPIRAGSKRVRLPYTTPKLMRNIIEAASQIKRFWDDIPNGMSIACAKNDKLIPTFLPILENFGRQYGIGPLKSNTRQIYRLGNTEIKLIRASDAIQWLNIGGDCYFALTTLDNIAEWATKAGYKRVRTFLEDYEVSKLGTNPCTVEVACAYLNQDIIDTYKKNGLFGVDKFARENGYIIASDIPNIAKAFFTSSLIDDSFSGAIELLPQRRYKLIVTVVETGKSLEDARWTRLSQFGPQAVLLNSQSCIVRKRRKNVPQDI